MMRVLITGGAGFIGCNLARHLRLQGCQVFALDDLSLGREANLPGEIPLLLGDVATESGWADVPEVDAVVHLAGASSAPMFNDRLVQCYHNNIEGLLRTLQYAHKCGAKRLVYASTSSVYGNVTPPLRESGPLDLPNFYAASKFCMEQIAQVYHRQFGLETVGLRFMSVYGPYEDHKTCYANLISQFIWDIEAGRAPVIYGEGDQTRDFTNVRDVAQAIWRTLAAPEGLGNLILNVGTSNATSINQLIGMLSDIMARPVRPRHIPNPVKSGYVQCQLGDIERAKALIGFEPSVPLREGIVEILRLRNLI